MTTPVRTVRRGLFPGRVLSAAGGGFPAGPGPVPRRPGADPLWVAALWRPPGRLRGPLPDRLVRDGAGLRITAGHADRLAVMLDHEGRPLVVVVQHVTGLAGQHPDPQPAAAQ